MNVRLRGHPRSGSSDDRGFTLIELLIALVLSVMIGGVVVAALITSLNAARSTTDQVNDTTDSELIAAFLVRDAQSAGGIDPSTAMVDNSLGVSNNPLDIDAAACMSGTPVVKVRFSWIDRSAVGQPRVVVTYSLGTDQQLVRRVCTASVPATVVDTTLGRNVVAADVTCQPAPVTTCAGRPSTVTMTVTGKGTRALLVSVLTASLRSSASQLTVIGPPGLPVGQTNVQYPFIHMSTIGASLTTAAGAPGSTTWSQSGLPAGLSINSSTGVIGGTPTAWGQFNVTITATDASSARATKTYSLTVHASPVAAIDGYSYDEDTALVIPAKGVLTNDSSPEGTPITALLYTGVANGTLSFAADGSFTYTPRAHFNGVDSFQYRATDGSLSSGIVTVTLTGRAVNDAPLVRVPVAQETRKNINKVFVNSSKISVSDVDATSLQVTLTATSGTMTLPVKTGLTFTAGDGTTDAVMTFSGTVANVNLDLTGATFVPTNNFTGVANLQVAANDLGGTGSGGTLADTKSVAINVTTYGIFTAFKDVGQVNVAGISSYLAPTYSVKGSGKDIWENNFDGFQFIYRSLTGDGSLTARIVSEDVTYNGTRNAGLLCWAADNSHQQPCESVAKAEVMFRVPDLSSSSAVHASVGLTQGNGSEFIYRTSSGASTGAASPGDALGAPYWVRLTRVGDQFTAEISPDGTTWTQRGSPQTIPMGTTINVGLVASAVYQLDTSTNQKIKTNAATFDGVSLSTPPVAVADSYFANEDSMLSVSAATGPLTNDSDPEGDALTATLVSGTSGLTLNADGSFTYLPPANFSGPATFSYVADDGILTSAATTVTLIVNPANETPSFTKGPDQVLSSTAGTQAISGWATAISQGVGETGQLLDFVVTNNNAALFSVQPAVAPDGTLTYAPIDGVSGVATVSVSLHDNGGTAFGAADTSPVQTFTIVVDDAPVVTTTGPSLAYMENATTAVDPALTITDSDNSNLIGATVAVTTNYVNGQDSLGFVNQNGISGTWNAASGTVTLTGSASVANYQAALRSITYNNNSDSPNTATRTVTFVVNDGLLASNPAIRTMSVTAVIDAPIVTATIASLGYTENATTPLDALVTVTDADSSNLVSATVDMSTGYVNGQDALAFVNQNGIVGTWNASTGTLTLSGSATVANYQAALRSITYNDNSDTPTTATRTVTVVVNDGLVISNTASRTITVTAVNDAPINTVPGAQTTAKNVAEVFSTATGTLIAINDVDAAPGLMRVQLVSTNGTTTLAGVSGLTFNPGDGIADATMTFTGTLANINAALDGLSFTPVSNFVGAASLQIVTNDQGNTGNGGALSDTETIVITVANAPVVTTTVANMAYTENGTTAVDTLVTVTDADSANLSSARVTMTTNYANGQDTLLFTTQNGITGVWNAATGTMTLSGTTTKANYQTALRSIRYNNTSNNPDTTTRTVTFVVNDGALDSNPASRAITITAVNDAPVVTATSGSMAYTENGTTVVDPTITVTDADNANIASATVTLTTYVAGQDTLSMLAQNGISAAWSAGVLTLSGTSSVENYQDALRSITYNNASHTPTTTTRTASFKVNDGTVNSNTATRTITLTAVNDAPVNSVPGPQTTAKNTTKVFSAANNNLISISDLDAGAAVVQVQLTATNGTITLPVRTGLTFVAGDGTTDATMTFTGTIANINLRLSGMIFTPTNNYTGAATLQIITNDKGNAPAPAATDTDSVTITVG